jgi:O-antigen/teichoic acid export membrane protein
MRGAYIEISSHAASYLIRLVSTLILSRLLFPEVFGLAAIVSVFIMGLYMLSDAGIAQGVVQSPRGDDPVYLNTAWTLSAARGIGLWLIACLGAWPMAKIYDEPILLYLIPAGAFTVVIEGFNSTSLHTLRRSLTLGKLAIVDFSTQLTSLVVTATWAFFSPSVWAVVAGGLAASLTRASISHGLQVGYKNRFQWDRESAHALFHFGKWIFASSSMTFVSRQADRLALGNFAGMGPLGIYSMATMLSEAAGALAQRITSGVLYPALSRVARENPEQLRGAYYRARLRTDLLGLAPLGGLCVMAQFVVDLLYDERYQEAGWMLQVLCVRAAFSVVTESMKDCLLAAGHARYGMYQSATRSLWMLLGIPVGWAYWGVPGIVLAAGASELSVVPVTFIAMHKHRLLRLSRELLAALVFLGGALLGALALGAVAVLESYGVTLFRTG